MIFISMRRNSDLDARISGMSPSLFVISLLAPGPHSSIASSMQALMSIMLRLTWLRGIALTVSSRLARSEMPIASWRTLDEIADNAAISSSRSMPSCTSATVSPLSSAFFTQVGTFSGQPSLIEAILSG